MKRLILLIAMIPSLGSCGSQSSDFDAAIDSENPLPPCPDYPNCVRITTSYPLPIDETWETTLTVFQQMGTYEMELSPDEYRIETVFLVVFFQDDMIVQLYEADTSSTLVHIRSASRVGYSDLGVNTRRVRDFLDLMDKQVSK